MINVHIGPRVHLNRPPFWDGQCYWFPLPFHECNWFPLPFHVSWNEVRFCCCCVSGRRFLLFCRKVRVCCPLRLSKWPHRDLVWESRCVKYAIQNFRTFSINRSYMLQLFQVSTVPYGTWLNQPNVCTMRTPASILAHLCVQNCRGRHLASLQSTNSWKRSLVTYDRCWISGLRCTWQRTRRNFWHNRPSGSLV